MQTQVMFYLLPDTLNDESAHYLQACFHAAAFYRQNQKVFIYTDNQDGAHRIDEMLWQFEPDYFVPHNLQGEGPSYGAPVEIGFSAPKNRRPMLINLASNMPNFASKHSHIVEFVPANESLKQQARERFKQYRQAGFIVNTQAVEQPETVN